MPDALPDGEPLKPLAGNGRVATTVIDNPPYNQVVSPGDIELTRIPHVYWQEVLTVLAKCQSRSKHATDPYCVMILGEPGVGKSALIDHYLQLNPPQDTPEGRIVPVLKVTTPSKPTTKAMVESAMLSLLGCVPVKGTTEELTLRFLQHLKIAGVELIILDEFQHVIDHGHAKFQQEISDWVKNLITLSRLPVALFGIPNSARILKNRQLERRFKRKIEIKRFLWSEKGLKEFSAFLTALEGSLPLKGKFGLGSEEMTRRFYYASDGILDTVMKTVREAAYLAKASSDGAITAKRLSRGYRTSMTDGKKVNPFLDPYEVVVKAAEEEVLNRKLEKRNRKSAKNSERAISSDEIMRPR